MIDVYFEPRKMVIDSISLPDYEPEMTEMESAFLCGIIKTIRPHKILEVGVAAGCTTAIILACLECMGISGLCEVHSVDISQEFYRDREKNTGFLAEDYKKQSESNFNHYKYYGDILPNVIDKIGGDIDLVILDTVHSVPGEILDFPVLIKYMNIGSHFVLHDIFFQHYFGEKGYSNNALFDTICGVNKEAPIMIEKGRPITNIGVIEISEDSYKYIENVFWLMTLWWRYLPDQSQLSAYKKFYSENYPGELVQIFDASLALNKERLEKERKNQDKYKHKSVRFLRRIKNTFKYFFTGKMDI